MHKPLAPLAQPPALHLTVQEAIKDYILENELRPGDPLPPEIELAKQLGISRTSVREAVKALESLGIVEARRGSGLYVKDFSFEPLLNNLQYGLLFDLRELADMFQVRQALETGMIEAALATMDDQQRVELQEIVEHMRLRAEQGEPFPREDRQFHQCLFRGLGNRTLLKLLDIFWLSFRKASEIADIRDPDPMDTYRLHAAVLEAVLNGDVERTIHALRQHYGGLEGRLARTEGRA